MVSIVRGALGFGMVVCTLGCGGLLAERDVDEGQASTGTPTDTTTDPRGPGANAGTASDAVDSREDATRPPPSTFECLDELPCFEDLPAGGIATATNSACANAFGGAVVGPRLAPSKAIRIEPTSRMKLSMKNFGVTGSVFAVVNGARVEEGPVNLEYGPNVVDFVVEGASGSFGWSVEWTIDETVVFSHVQPPVDVPRACHDELYRYRVNVAVVWRAPR